MYERTLRAAALALALGFGLAAGAGTLSPAVAQAASGPTVGIDNFTFGPATLTVKVGTTVTWINRDDVPHTVVADDKSFKSPVMDTDGSFSFTFTKAGEYGYFCSLHPHMVGKVVVNAS